MGTPSRYSDSLGLADAAQTMSPAHSRLQELSHRMTAVHDDFDAEKNARSSVMELKCRAIDEKIMRNKRSEDERLKPVQFTFLSNASASTSEASVITSTTSITSSTRMSRTSRSA